MPRKRTRRAAQRPGRQGEEAAAAQAPEWVYALAAFAIVATGVAAFWWLTAGHGGADPKDAAQVALGQRVYAERCASCHGAELEGQPNWRQRKHDGKLPAPPHDASGHTWHHPDSVLFKITKHGTAAAAPLDYKSDMPGFAGTLSDEEIWAVLAYIKSRWPGEVQARQPAR